MCYRPSATWPGRHLSAPQEMLIPLPGLGIGCRVSAAIRACDGDSRSVATAEYAASHDAACTRGLLTLLGLADRLARCRLLTEH